MTSCHYFLIHTLSLVLCVNVNIYCRVFCLVMFCDCCHFAQFWSEKWYQEVMQKSGSNKKRFECQVMCSIKVQANSFHAWGIVISGLENKQGTWQLHRRFAVHPSCGKAPDLQMLGKICHCLSSHQTLLWHHMRFLAAAPCQECYRWLLQKQAKQERRSRVDEVWR